MSRPVLTAARVRELLLYNPDTGVFTWRVRQGRVHAGEVAGTAREHYCGHRRIIQVDRKVYHASRLAWLWMTGDWPSLQIDHVNLDGLDNRWSNLREATQAQNQANRRRVSTNTSGFKGVSWNNFHRRWHAQTSTNGRHVYLGHYDTPEAAHAAYAHFAETKFGAFARVK
jgi:hypothetical protein